MCNTVGGLTVLSDGMQGIVSLFRRAVVGFWAVSINRHVFLDSCNVFGLEI